MRKSPLKEEKFDINNENLQSPSPIPPKHHTGEVVKVAANNFEGQGKHKAPAESYGLRQYKNKKKDKKLTFEGCPKKVSKEPTIIFDEGGDVEDEVLVLIKKKKR
ncbi:hypothetical protein RYX36_033714 [Vicia faba]